MKTRGEHSAGGVVIRTEGDRVDVALASRRTKRGGLAWGLPKGLVEPGERPEEAAIREVQEEVGLVAEIIRSLGDISYWYVWEGTRVRKTVSFFLMSAIGGDIAVHDHEMEEVAWFALSEAAGVASYPSERTVLRRAAQELARTE